ncbi:MAG: M90 family metallopeptidase [Betaproteobacteria bacterium]
MFSKFRAWRRRRVLATQALPDALWNEAVALLPFLEVYRTEELAALRDKVVLFLAAKSVVGAHEFAVTPLMRVVIAIQACVLILYLAPDAYDGWENIVVYPDEFRPRIEYEDEAGVVHVRDHEIAGEAWDGGPVLLSWADVELSRDFAAAGMNLVIHEFAHKLDMGNGAIDGMPRLRRSMSVAEWRRVADAAYNDFVTGVEAWEAAGEPVEYAPTIDPYAADAPEEFFAVCSEVFFAAPELLRDAYPDYHAQLAAYYGQDLAARRDAAPTSAS